MNYTEKEMERGDMQYDEMIDRLMETKRKEETEKAKNNMSLKVNSNRRRSYNDRHIANGFNAYPDSNATELVDKFFSDNKIHMLDFKCKTWSKLKARATKINIAEMKNAWPYAGEIAYSRTAGCSCGCSPGYKIRKTRSNEFYNHDVWCTIKADISGLEADLPKFQKMLNDEIASNKDKVTA